MASFKKYAIFKYEILMCLLFIVSLTSAQDFVPELPDYMRTTTTTTTTEVPITTVAPKANKTITTTTPATTKAPIDTDAPTTTPATITTTPGMTTTPTPTRTTHKPTTTSTSTTQQTPSYDPTPYPWPPKRQPSRPDYWNRGCYYKQQRGTAQLTWNCGQLQWVFSVDCFHCCYYDFTSFAGCYKVHNQYCAHYLD